MLKSMLALAAVLTLVGCDGPPLAVPDVGAVGPTRSTGLPFGVNDGELETVNSLPSGFVTRNPIAPETGVVGVTHAPP